MGVNGGAAGVGRRGFATTRWSMVLAAGQGDSSKAGAALAELCAHYWYPLYAYARRRGYEADAASDLTQAFFVKLLEKRDLRAADPLRGRFRTFLLSAMKNFLSGEWRKEHTLKRGLGVEVLSLDFVAAEEAYRREPAGGLSPEAIYQRRWALGLLERAVDDLQQQYVASGKAELFAALKSCVGGETESLPYAELAQQLGQSEGALRTAASRLRSRWRRRLRQLVAETVDREDDVEAELRSLITSLDMGV